MLETREIKREFLGKVIRKFQDLACEFEVGEVQRLYEANFDSDFYYLGMWVIPKTHVEEVKIIGGKYWVKRFKTVTNCDPPEQDVVEVYEIRTHYGITSDEKIAFMGSWSTLCISKGSGINALEATDEEVVFAVTHDESVFD